MQKSHKNLLTLAVVCVLSFSLLAGCNGGGEVSSAPPPPSSNAVQSSTPASSATAESSSAAESSVSSKAETVSSAPGGIVKPIETDDKEFDKKFLENSLDAGYKKELNDAFSNTDMIAVSDKYTALWKKEVAGAYKKLIAVAADTEKETFKKEQDAWQAGAPAALKKIIAAANEAGGSLGAVDAASETMDFYRDRANSLYEKLYRYDKEFSYEYK